MIIFDAVAVRPLLHCSSEDGQTVEQKKTDGTCLHLT